MKADKNAYIPEETEIMTATKKGERRSRGYAVSATIVGHGTHSTNFKSEVDAREYMQELRARHGTKLLKCKIIPMF